ncbi:pseudaminic acid synthase [Candidatus Nomurabacteria bacterium]|nr:pseudaminic acid synthase [Candidatus Nomurabacteria bacterium]
MDFKIKNRKIGDGHPAFIIAEMSGNHNHSLSKAKKIVDAVAKSGADAIKLQTYTPDTLTIDVHNKYFTIKSNNIWKGKNLYELYKKAYTPWEWQEEIKKYSEKKGLICFSTPFDETAVDFLEKMKVPLYKVASFEIQDLELLARIGKTKKPVIISRGLASKDDIENAIKTLKRAGSKNIVVLHCISAYPAKLADMNVRTVSDIRKTFKVLSGLSDHSISHTATIAAIAQGACVIEKHITLKRSDGGPDAEFSLEPLEFKQLVKEIRDTELALGKVSYEIGKNEKNNVVFRRSIFAVEDIQKGEKITRKNIRVIRPGYGLPPTELKKVLGSVANKNIKKGNPILWPLIQKKTK